MTLFSYEIFDAVARQGSFNKAAQQLHLTPSAISHAIAVMEAELGFTLFNRGKNGVTALHISTFHEQMDMVVYCVEHGSDVNCIAGVNRVTPISIMFVPISNKLTGLGGTPFVHHKAAVKEIRRYLMSCGAKDSFRFGY